MKKFRICCLCCLCCCLASCISTKDVPDDDQLFVGLTKITYDEDKNENENQNENRNKNENYKQHLADTKTEVEAALATAPNGALFGSSYHRVPFSWRLWVYNKYNGKESKFAKWMAKSFGRPPVLMSTVNPALRASVAQSVLKNNGFLRASVTYEPVTRKNPKKGKIAYHVRLDSLFTYDSIAHVGFPDVPRHLIDSTAAEAYIQRGTPFSVAALENERSRIGTLLRNNGYYYFNPTYVNYLADTINTPNRAQLRLQLSDGLPSEAMRQWYIGNTEILFRRTMREQLTDSIHRRSLHILFNGKNPPIRPRVVLKDMRLRPRQLYSNEKYQETVAKLNATGVFSAVDLQLTPRRVDPLTVRRGDFSTDRRIDSLTDRRIDFSTDRRVDSLTDRRIDSLTGRRGGSNDTLDLRMTCTFDKPYDFYFESTLNGRTIGRYGPEAKVGFTRRNTFKGAETLDVNLHGSYEWQKSGNENMNSYQYGFDTSIEFPRIIAPFYNSDRTRRGSDGRPRRPRRFISTPTTLAKVSTDIIRRPTYYKMHIASGEWTYRWQSSLQSSHEFSPLTLKYQYMNSSTANFDTILSKNPYLIATMEDHFIPKMRYTYFYTSPATRRHPIRWETTVEESGNGMALFDVLIQGHNWNQKNKTFFKNPYAQFLRVETDLVKTWMLSSHSSLVGHLNAGVMYSYGNTASDDTPFSEKFYAGGANSIRAFTVRGVGPGSFAGIPGNRQFAYIMQNGDLKLVANLEYRTRLFGSLGGALFVDIGNVWNWKDIHFDPEDYNTPEDQQSAQTLNKWFENTHLRLSRLADQLALGTGVGLRYDLGFLVVRIDWGLALHVPYQDARDRYFLNWSRFRDAHTLHFAIGYPF